MTFNGKIVGAELCPGDRTLIHVEVVGSHPIQMSGECVLTIGRAALAPESGGRECRCGCHTRGMCLDCKSEHAPSSPASAQPDPKDLEITERDRWAWRLGWSAAMSIRLDRPVNPSDAPEPPATAPRPGEG